MEEIFAGSAPWYRMTGLVLGKFAPLHKGHQLLIETALRENTHVIAMIYDSPEVTNIPLPIRSRWRKQLYPSIQVIEAWNGPAETGDTPEIKRKHEKYILEMLNGTVVTNFYSSEFYGHHVSQTLGACDRRIDPCRHHIPVSGTSIRNNPYAQRNYLEPIVYRDLITKVVFLGAPSTGKTTLAKALANTYDTVWMSEYGREYWDAHQQNRRLTLEQLVEIAEEHRIREDTQILDANKFFFIDTDATTTFMFSVYYHGEAHSRLIELAAETIHRYDLFFLCGTDIPYDDTWDRSGEMNRQLFQEQIEADLLQRNIPIISLTGSLSERMEKVSNTLAEFDKYRKSSCS